MAQSLKDLLKDIVFMPDGTPIPKSALKSTQKQTAVNTVKQTAKEKQDILKNIAYTPDGTPVPKSALNNKGPLEALGAVLIEQQEKLKDYTITPEGIRIPKDFKPASVLPEGYAYTPDGTPVPKSALNNPGFLETFNTPIAELQEKLKDYTVTPEGIRIPKDFKPASVLPEGYAYTPDNTPVPEWTLNKGQGDDGGVERRYVIGRLLEQDEYRETFQADIKAAGLDRRTARDALRTYDQLRQGGAGSKRAALQLQAEMLRAAAQKAEINADLNVKKTEGIIRLRPLYTAVQQAAKTGDRTAFENAKERYAYAYALEQAKHQAAKAKVQSSFNAVDDGVKRALAGVQGQFAASAGGVNSGILDHTSGASPYGKINGAGDVAQERFGAPAGGILDHTSGASPYGKINRPVDATWDDSRLNKLQAFLDAVGMIPGFGEAADGLNALISLMRGNYVDAGLSVASMIPFVGWGATAGKAGKYALEGADVLGTVARYGDEGIEAGEAILKSTGKAAGDVVEGAEEVAGELVEGAGDNFTIGSFDELLSNVQNSYKGYESNGWKGNYSGQAPGTNAGSLYRNKNKLLPKIDPVGNPITYKEFDVNNRIAGTGRDAERFIVGSDGSIYYTKDHYTTFTKIQ